jgi:hypothetical protein
MKSSIALITSVRSLVSVALVTASLVFGIVIRASAAPTSLAQWGETATSLSSTLYVDCAARSRGNGAPAHPYWRITDALERARLLRRSTNTRLTISVAPGTCSGNFEPQPTGQGSRPPELLPLVLNVPNLTLHGAGVMRYAGGYPVAARAGTATRLTVDTAHLSDIPNPLIYVGPTTDGGRADGAVIEGFVLHNAFNVWFGIDISQAQDITVRGNVVTDTWLGGINGSECSGRIVGNVAQGGSPGIFVGAGTPSNPSRVYIGGNRVTENTGGVTVFGDSSFTDFLDMGANPLQPLPHPINPTKSHVGNHIEVELEGNNISNNYFGLRLGILGGGRYPYAQTGNISVNVHENRFIDDGFPLVVDEGFVFRGTNSYWTDPSPDVTDFPEGFLAYFARPFITNGPFDGPYSGNVNAILEGNVWENPNITPYAPAILTYSNLNVYNYVTGAPVPGLVPIYAYMRNSRLNFRDGDGVLSQPGVIRDDLREFDPLDGTTRLHNRTRISH